MTRPVAITGRGIAREGARGVSRRRRASAGSRAVPPSHTGASRARVSARCRPTSTTCARSPSPTSTADRRGRRGRGRRARQARPRPRRRPTTCAATPRRAPGPSSGTTSRELPELAGGAAGEKALRPHHPCRRQPRVAPAQCIDLIPSEMTASPLVRLPQHHRPGLPLRRAQEGRGLLRPRGLLLPGHGVHPRGGASAGRRSCALPRVRRGRDAGDQRPDGQRGRLQRPRRLPEPRRPQGRAAAHRQGGQQPHRQGRPPERPADGRAAGTSSPATRARSRPRSSTSRCCADNPYKADVPATARAHRAGATRAHHPRQEHGAPPGAGGRGADASSTRSARAPCSCTTWRTSWGSWGRTSSTPSPRAPTSSPGRPTRPSSAPSAASSAAVGRSRGDAAELWEAIERRAFPGSVSNHHLGTLLGLLMAAYEMNHFRDEYQQAVIAQRQGLRPGARRGRARRRGRPGAWTTRRRTR